MSQTVNLELINDIFKALILIPSDAVEIIAFAQSIHYTDIHSTRPDTISKTQNQ